MDRKCLIAIRKRNNLAVVWYMLYQYARYVEGVQLVSDRVYKVMRSTLLWNWNEITHPFLELLDKEDVECDIKFSNYGPSYPKVVITCANLYIKEYWQRKKL